MRRPAAARPVGQLDLSVCGDGGRRAARGGSRRAGRRSPGIDRAPDPGRRVAGPDRASSFSASPAALPGGRAETQQSESRHGTARAAGRRRPGGGGPRRSRIPGGPSPRPEAGPGGGAGRLVRVGGGHLLRWSEHPTASSVCLTNPLATRYLSDRSPPLGRRRQSRFRIMSHPASPATGPPGPGFDLTHVGPLTPVLHPRFRLPRGYACSPDGV
jgi:hypothetical protein